MHGRFLQDNSCECQDSRATGLSGLQGHAATCGCGVGITIAWLSGGSTLAPGANCCYNWVERAEGDRRSAAGELMRLLRGTSRLSALPLGRSEGAPRNRKWAQWGCKPSLTTTATESRPASGPWGTKGSG
jgi:hypothetical protein